MAPFPAAFFTQFCAPALKCFSSNHALVLNAAAHTSSFLVTIVGRKEISATCQIKCMPTFQFYKDGKKVAEMSGADPNKLKELVEQNK